MPDLFDPLHVKSWNLPNRLVMAPLTRNRAGEGMVPGDLAVEYYAQRASRRPDHHRGHPAQRRRPGLPRTPPASTPPSRSRAGAAVADAVHAKGGRIVVAADARRPRRAPRQQGRPGDRSRRARWRRRTRCSPPTA